MSKASDSFNQVFLEKIFGDDLITDTDTQPAAPSPRPWKVEFYNRPDLDDDPLCVFQISNIRNDLEERYFAAEPETPELDAVHAENEAIRAYVENAVNEREELIGALRNLVEFMDKSGMSTTTVGGKDPFKYGGFEYSVVSEARAVLAKVDGE